MHGCKKDAQTTEEEINAKLDIKRLSAYDRPGLATYIGCMTTNALIEKIIRETVKKAGLWGELQQLNFPIIVKQGINEQGNAMRYFFNYAAKPVTFNYAFALTGIAGW